MKCALCNRKLGPPGPKPKDRAAVISLRLLYGDAGDSRTEDCAIMCANCAGDAWEAMLAWMKEQGSEGVEKKIREEG